MVTPLLTTKLYIPHARPGLVSRQRLIEQLNAGLSCSLTLVSAPAGYGKTILLSEWINKNKLPTGWLTLDKDDNDPLRFWSYCVKALQTIRPNIGESALKLLQLPPPSPIEPIVTTIINEMSEVSEELALVLDERLADPGFHMIRDFQ